LKKVIVTGGAGFIGSNLVRFLLKKKIYTIVFDKLTYAALPDPYKDIKKNNYFESKKIDIADRLQLKNLFEKYKPDSIFHLAAESHVDRSILAPAEFISTNILGTYNLLDFSYSYWKKITSKKKRDFRFLHVSTDEVYGDLSRKGKIFNEKSQYKPNSPYSASKAASDHLVRAWNKTYNLPTIITNCTNNYGPYQNPEKFIPVIIMNAINERKIPIYGDGNQIRDWIHVQDHVRGLYEVMRKGQVGKTYNISSKYEKKNIHLANLICKIVEKKTGKKNLKKLINLVKDRPGHDKRYALDNKKIIKEIGWRPTIKFEDGIKKTVEWYISNLDLWKNVKGKY
jgi:dTDP-glucose 4,6-dehydratase